jgi:hypothetical protein
MWCFRSSKSWQSGTTTPCIPSVLRDRAEMVVHAALATHTRAWCLLHHRLPPFTFMTLLPRPPHCAWLHCTALLLASPALAPSCRSSSSTVAPSWPRMSSCGVTRGMAATQRPLQPTHLQGTYARACVLLAQSTQTHNPLLRVLAHFSFTLGLWSALVPVSRARLASLITTRCFILRRASPWSCTCLRLAASLQPKDRALPRKVQHFGWKLGRWRPRISIPLAEEHHGRQCGACCSCAGQARRPSRGMHE